MRRARKKQNKFKPPLYNAKMLKGFDVIGSRDSLSPGQGLMRPVGRRESAVVQVCYFIGV